MALKKSDIAVQIEKEHECLKRDMGDIKTEVTREVIAEDFSDWRLEFLWRLRDFRTHLQKHFDLEEEGGFMNELLKEAPQALNSIKKLETEHDQIVSDLDGILTQLKELELKDDRKLADIQNRVTTLVSTIQKHESAENELMQKVYCQEYGYPA
ncbi:MAG: hemerythrin domain-containing protein [bacterium]